MDSFLPKEIAPQVNQVINSFSNIVKLGTTPKQQLKQESIYTICVILEKKFMAQKVKSFFSIKTTSRFSNIMEELLKNKIPGNLILTLTAQELKMVRFICSIFINQRKKMYKGYQILQKNSESMLYKNVVSHWTQLKVIAATKIARIYTKINSFKTKDNYFRRWKKNVRISQIFEAHKVFEPAKTEQTQFIKRSIQFLVHFAEKKNELDLTGLAKNEIFMMKKSELEKLIEISLARTLSEDYLEIDHLIDCKDRKSFDSQVLTTVLKFIGLLVKDVKKKKLQAIRNREYLKDKKAGENDLSVLFVKKGKN